MKRSLLGVETAALEVAKAVALEVAIVVALANVIIVAQLIVCMVAAIGRDSITGVARVYKVLVTP